MTKTHMLPLVAAAGLVLGACADATAPSPAARAGAAAPLHAAAPGYEVEGRYIVVLKDGVDARAVAAAARANPRHVYTSALNGFAATLNTAQLAAVRNHPAVAYVEADQRTRSAVTQTGAPWGLDRIDQRSLPLSTTFSYNVAGGGVFTYVIDSGIQSTHPAFAYLQAQNVYDAFGGNGEDCNGHGTHIAGIIGGSMVHAVAKGANLRGLRVLDCLGQGYVSDVIDATDWVRLNRINPAVANLSLVAPYTAALNTAVNNLSNSGVLVTVAAGDGNANACNYSPASASAAVTVAASDSADWRAGWSNHGGCVDLYAPGVNIASLWIGGTTATHSGTSQASAFAAGVGHLYKAMNGQVTSITITSWMTNNATLNVIKGNASGTANRLLWKGTL